MLSFSNLLSVASHDLQEPLRGVAGCLEIIEETYKGKLDDKIDNLIRHAVEGAVAYACTY